MLKDKSVAKMNVGEIFLFNPLFISMVLASIPKIEASVPTTVLADMFGQATPDVLKRLDLAANGWMHFTNAAKGIFGAFANTAPVLAPCLGLLGVGFGFISRELTSVSPADIMTEVNKAIAQVIEETNRRFEVMQEYVDQSVRNVMKENMNDDYKGQFETWNKCLELPTKTKIDDCQEGTARIVGSLKYGFMFENKFSQNAELSNTDVKAVELQLPILKKWADFHLLVLAALMKTYKEGNGSEAAAMYRMYRSHYIEAGNDYVAYMEWGLAKIRKARIEDNSISPSWECQSFDDVTKFDPWTKSNMLKTSTRTCSFKCDSMRPEYCDMTSVRDCTTDTTGCILCGSPCNLDRRLVVQHRYLDNDQNLKRKEICTNYVNRLTSDLNAFWTREVELFLPIYKETIKKLEKESQGGEQKEAHKRQGNITDDSSRQDFLPKAKFINDFMKKKAEKKMQFDEIMLRGTTNSQSLANYLRRVRKNSKILKNKVMAEKKKKENRPVN